MNIPIHTSTRTIFSTMLCSVAAVCLVVPRCADAQEVSGTLPDTPLGQRTGELLNAFNSGSLDSIIGFVSDSFIPKTIEQRGGDRAVATYWAGVDRETGPLSFHSIEHRTLGQRTAEIVWLYGDVSRAWIGVILRLEGVAPYRVTGHSVLRGVRPLLKPEMEFPEAIGEYLDSYLTRMADADIFSGAVLLARDGKIVFEGAYGFENRSTNRTMSLDSRFKLASVTKMFTGVAIVQLAEAGKLKFDDKMSKYIPEYPKHIGKKVTIHQLLTHQSGIELDDYPRYNRDAAKAQSVDDLLQTQLKYIKRLNLGNYDDFEPLGSYDYTNEGIDLLGVIVERASKETWPKYIADHIFAKAWMENTGTDTVDGDPGLVSPYSSLSTLGTSAAERRAVDGKRNLTPAGSGWSTAKDMFLFMEALRTNRLLSEEMTQRIMTGQVEVRARDDDGTTTEYGYTMDVVTRKGHREVGHRGATPGVSTAVRLYPDDGWSLIILSNYDRVGNIVLMHIEDLIAAAD